MNKEINEFVDGKVKSLFTKQAAIEFVYDEDESCWVIQQLDSSKKGEGKEIIKAFVNKVGSNQKVELSSILEEKTCGRLFQLGILDFVYKNQKPVTVSSEGILKTLKIVRVARGGGLTIEKVVVEPVDPSIRDDEIIGLPYQNIGKEIPYLQNIEIKVVGRT